MKKSIAALLVSLAMAVPSDADPTKAAQGANRFASELYRVLAPQDGNVFFSPFSISTALTMTRGGALGSTAAELDKCLHLTSNPHQELGKMMDRLNNTSSPNEVRVVNRLWPNRNLTVKAAFLDLLKQFYHVTVEALDFSQPTANRTINDWVSSQTHEKIKDLIPDGLLHADTRLVLTNAIYFYGTWQSEFESTKTEPATFLSRGGSTQTCQLMNKKAKFGYAEWPGFQMVELPYSGERLSMLVLLPRSGKDLAVVEKDLGQINNWAQKLQEKEVLLSLPRFKMTESYSLVPALQNLGVSAAFGHGARFDDIGGHPGELYISAVLHKAFVDVQEKGTEAAAATAVVMTRSLAAAPTFFRADHTFVFVIRDRESGVILFLGRLDKP